MVKTIHNIDKDKTEPRFKSYRDQIDSGGQKNYIGAKDERAKELNNENYSQQYLHEL